MAGSSRELGLPKSNRVSSRREQLARNTLRNVRSKGHSYVELREDNKKPIFFCVLCRSPCYNDGVLHDHLRGHLHKKMCDAAKSTLLKENPWPFNDGMLFFHTPCDENNCLLTSSADPGSNLLQSESINKNSLAVVAKEGNESACDSMSERSLSSLGGDECVDVGETGHLIIPGVLHKDKVSDLEVKSIGLGKIAVRTYEKDGVTKGIGRIWCEWLGDCHPNQEDIIPLHDFAIVSFAFNYDMGRKGLFDDMSFLPSSCTRPTLQENKESRGKKRKSLSDPEDVSESLSIQYESSGKEFLASGNSSSRNYQTGHGDNSPQLRLMRSRSVRKELRMHRRLASERVCDICQHKMLPGKDVAALLNMKTGRLVCSSRNLSGAFHVFHISCLIHWVLICDYEVYTKQLVGPKVKKRYRRKKAAKISEAEKEVGKEIYSAFCPECQGTGIDIDGDELEKITVLLSEMFRYKMKVSDGRREYTKHPEMLQNCSTGFYFPPQPEETMQEYVSPLKMLRFYRAAE